MRVLDFFEVMAEDRPVVITTHSDAWLDGLSDPHDMVILYDLDDTFSTRLLQPERKALDEWLLKYRGIGELRSDGYDKYVMKRVGNA